MPKKILLADDSITIQKVVELTFSDADYEVTAVNNGAKAVARLAEMRPDIILSDIIMPEKNGYEVCEYVKSHPEYRNIPVVLLTGTFEPFDPDRAEKAGCDAVVTKPFESQSLIQKVEELIASSASASAASSASAAAPAPEPEPEPPAPEPSPWSADTEVVPLPSHSPFSTSSGTFPTPAPSAFEHEPDIFNAPPPSSAATDMPFETAAAEEFSGETRAFPRMSFDEMQQMMEAPAPAPEIPPAPPEPSPWDEQQEPAFGGETRAFPKMTFDEIIAQEARSSTPPQEARAREPEPLADLQPDPQPEPQLELESESPFGAPPPAEEFSGETRAFPKMTFEEMQQFEAQTAPPPPPAPEPEPEVVPAPEPSPWDEQPDAAFGGETRAFPKMTFDEMMAAQSPAEPAPSPWEEPPQEPEGLPWETPIETAYPADEEAPAYAAEEEATPFAASEPAVEELPFGAEANMAAPEESYADSYVEEVPPPAEEPQWAPAAEAEARGEETEPPVPSPLLAPETPSIPIAARDLTDEQVDRIARRVVELMSDHVVRNIAWEVIPDLAEMVVKERIRQLESEA